MAYGVTDNPSLRKLHKVPVPYLGGVAIAITALFSSAFLRGWRAEVAVIILGATLVGVFGLVDDLRQLGVVTRIVAEVVAAALAVAAGSRVELTHTPADWAATVVWLVVVTNAFNLVDNMDGAAGAVATVTGVGLAVAAGLQGQWLVGSLAVVVAGSCAGFLVYNWHPARIFMGDAGSLFVGYLLAAVALKLRFPVPQFAGLVAVALFTLPILLDTALVVISRISSGRPIYEGGTDHSAHRLLGLGLSSAQVVGVMALACAACSLLGIAVGRGVVEPGPAAVGSGCAAVATLVMLLRIPPGYRSTAALQTEPPHVS